MSSSASARCYGDFDDDLSSAGGLLAFFAFFLDELFFELFFDCTSFDTFKVVSAVEFEAANFKSG